jgi:hypothetical protein
MAPCDRVSRGSRSAHDGTRRERQIAARPRSQRGRTPSREEQPEPTNFVWRRECRRISASHRPRGGDDWREVHSQTSEILPESAASRMHQVGSSRQGTPDDRREPRLPPSPHRREAVQAWPGRVRSSARSPSLQATTSNETVSPLVSGIGGTLRSQGTTVQALVPLLLIETKAVWIGMGVNGIGAEMRGLPPLMGGHHFRPTMSLSIALSSERSATRRLSRRSRPRVA